MSATLYEEILDAVSLLMFDGLGLSGIEITLNLTIWVEKGVGEVSSEQWSSEQCTAVLLHC